MEQDATYWARIRAELEAHPHAAEAAPLGRRMWTAACPCGWTGLLAPFSSRADARAFAQQHVDAVTDFLEG